MKRILTTLAILAVMISVGCFAHAQTTPTYCTTTTPCAQLNWTNGSDVTATVTTAVIANPSGSGTETVETAGPATAIVYRCTVTATQPCTITNNVPAAPSAWTPVAVTNGQSLAETTSAGGPFYDTSVAYGNTYSYSLTLTWTGSLGGVATGYATPFQLVFAAPTNTPSAPAVPTGIVVVPVS